MINLPNTNVPLTEKSTLYEQKINYFFSNYPIELIEENIYNAFSPFLPCVEDRPDDNFITYMQLFYEELQHMVKTCAKLYGGPKKDLNSRNPESLNAIISFIKEVIPTGYIFCNTFNASRVDLVIIMDKHHYKPFDEVHTLLNFAVLGYENINCTVHAYGTMHDTLSKGHIYYSALCIPANCVYQKEIEFTLPVLHQQQCATLIERATILFEQNLHKAVNFYTGAEHFLKLKESNMSAFMLQQACELTYRSLILSLRGREIKCHDLIILRKHLMHFVPEVKGVFDKEDSEEIRMLASIQEAYIKSRYDSAYQVCITELIKLFEGTNRFINSAKQIFTAQRLKIQSVLNLKVSQQ